MIILSRNSCYRTLLAPAAIIALLLSLQGCAGKATETKQGGDKGGGRKGAGGDAPVLVTTATEKNVPVELEVIGNVEAYASITVRAQIGGELTQVNFQEGDFVKKGAVLFKIDARPLEAGLKQAEANLSRDNAALGQAQANLARDAAQEQYTRSQSARYARLFQEGVMSREQAEQTSSAADAQAQAVAADRAAIESAKAQIEATKALIDNAKVQLGYTTIRSPLDGRTGNLAVRLGNLISANVMDMITINQVQPIYVTFSVPESNLGAIKQYMANGKLQVSARSQDGSGDPEIGTLTFIDNAVDTSTGTIKLKGTFTNPDRRLWPGQFVRVRLRLTTQMAAVVVPNQAVQTGQDGTFVYVVKADRTVEARPVVTGQRVDTDLVIDRGLRAGEVVVTEGQLRLAPGSHIVLREGPTGGRGPGRGGRGGKGGGQSEKAPDGGRSGRPPQ